MTVRRVSFLSLLSGTALCGSLAFSALAQNPPTPQTTPPANPTELDAVTSAATRNKRPIDAVPGTVSVITDQDMERDNITNIRELTRNEPGVSVGNNINRAGLTNFVIRGIGGNRVLVMVDGVRSADYPGSNAGAGLYTRDTIDLDGMKRVEIIRGPASALYGSDAIGGVVAYITKDPSDYLITGGRDVYASAKVTYDGSNNSWSETFTGVVRTGIVEFMGLYTRRDGGATSINSSQFEPNPQRFGENNFLAKFVVRPTDHDVIRIVGEMGDIKTSTHAYSSIGNSNLLFARVWDEWGNDYSQRYRLSAQWEHTAPIGFVDRFDFMLYYTETNRQEDTWQLRGPLNGTTITNYRTSNFIFNQKIRGAELQMSTSRDLFGAVNNLTYGASFSWSTSTRPRDRSQVNTATGAWTNTVGGEAFPNKNFPDTETIQAGVYLQDEIVAGRWTIVPALRLDYYSLLPNPDASYWRTAVGLGTLPVATTYFSASPKLGAIYRITDEYSTYAQYARGFRAPPYDNANLGFVNLASFYQILPNANLRPETVDSFELGFRGKYAGGSSWQLSGFYNYYKDFIDTTVVGMNGPVTLFQYTNLSAVTIYGFEARGEYRFMPEWSLIGFFSWAYGFDNGNGQPIDSVDPWKLQGRVRYGTPGTGFGAQLIGTVVGAHNRVSWQNTAGFMPQFQAPGYFNLDATVSYAWNPHLVANAGAFNITNAQYWNAQDVIGVPNNSPYLERYTQPGRYFGANLTIKW